MLCVDSIKLVKLICINRVRVHVHTLYRADVFVQSARCQCFLYGSQGSSCLVVNKLRSHPAVTKCHNPRFQSVKIGPHVIKCDDHT